METPFFGMKDMQKVKRTLYSNLQKGKNNPFGYAQRETSFEEKYYELLSRLHQTLSDYTQDLNKLKPYENQQKLLENLTKSIQQEAAKDNPPKSQNSYEYTRTKTIHQKKIEQTTTERVPATRYNSTPPKTVPGYNRQQATRRTPAKTTVARDYGRIENSTRERAGGYKYPQNRAAKVSSSTSYTVFPASKARAHLKNKAVNPDKNFYDIFVRYDNSANVSKPVRRCAACSGECRLPFYP